MKSITLRAPAFLMLIISLATLPGAMRDTKWWPPLFFGFLPAAFFLVAAMMSKMNRENARLRRRVSRLEQRLDRSRTSIHGPLPNESDADDE